MRLLVVLIALCMLPYGYAATLTAKKSVEILALDGQKYNKKLIESKDFVVTDGTHQIVVRYSKSFPGDGIVTSKPYIFNIQVAGDTTIAVKRFNSHSQAKNAVGKGLTWVVKNENKTEMIDNADILLGEGFLPYSNIENVIAKYNQNNGIMLPSATGSLVFGASATAINAKVEQLIKAYNSADKQEQKAFRIWLIEQEMQ